MRILILFGAWVGSQNEDSLNWVRYYRDLLSNQFGDCDKFIAVSHKSAVSFRDAFRDLKNLLDIDMVDPGLHVDSDASQFQLALRRCKEILCNYDYIFFMHTKGASYNFDLFEPWRNSLSTSLFNHQRLLEEMGKGELLIAERGFMVSHRGSIVSCQSLANDLGIKSPVFHFAAGQTNFCVPSNSCAALLEILPDSWLSSNILALGYNRFFFESLFPSMLTMLGLEPTFLGGASFNPHLSSDISYDCDPQHSSLLVLREFARRREEGDSYRQVPVPYVFGHFDDVRSINIQFAV